MADKLREPRQPGARVKATFLLSTELMDAMRQATHEGIAVSVNAFVAQALREKLIRLRDERRRAALAEAATDPLFLADIAEVERDFEGCTSPPRKPQRRS